MVESNTKKGSGKEAQKNRNGRGNSAPSSKRKTPTLGKFTLAGLLLAIALSAAIGYGGYQWVLEERTAKLERLSREYALASSTAVAERLAEYQTRLHEFAQQPASTAALTNADPDAIASLQQQLQNEFPEAVRTRVLPKTTPALQSAEQFALRFAEMDMVRRAERGEAVLPEAAKVDDQWQFALVAPVSSSADTDEPALGTVLVSLPIEIFAPVLEQASQNLGRTELQQSFNSRQHSLLLGAGAGQFGEPQIADIPLSYWQVNFTPSQRLWQQTQTDLTLPVGIWLTISVICLALAAIVGRWLDHTNRAAVPYKQSLEKETGTARAAGTSKATGELDDILDIDISDEDEALLGLESGQTPAKPEPTPPAPPAAPDIAAADIPQNIFRAYDIRGLAETEITPQLAQQIGQALGSEALENGQKALIVARDARTHGPVLTEHLVRGILSSGCNVINIGVVPTPLMYFATETLPQTQSGVMVTASHNSAEYNGFKVVIAGHARSEDDIQNLRQRILTSNFRSGQGTEEAADVVPAYIDAIKSDLTLAGAPHIVLDAGNSVAGTVAPDLFEQLGCQVTQLHCELDGNFPNHEPDPSIAVNLQDLIAKVLEVQADLGVAFDGDGDRLTVVTSSGEIIWADRLLMLFAKDIVAHHPGADVVFDVKSSRQLESVINGFGGRPVMWKTGHAPMRAKMVESGALVGGEYSGHIFIKDRWYGFDDGIYAAARLVEIMSSQEADLDSLFAEFPPLLSTPEIRIAVAEDKKFAIVRQLTESSDFADAKLITLDGLRAEYPNGWGLVRASNTSSDLTLRFEAETEDELHRLKSLFAQALKKVDSSIDISWS